MADTIRVRRAGGYTTLQNSMIVDKRLSLKTKGLMAVILSRPDGWDYSVKGLAAFCGVGRDAVRTSLKELEEAGYLTREQSHGEGGKFGGNIYVIRETSGAEPDLLKDAGGPLPGFPSTGEPLTVEPSPENPTQRNNDLKKEGLKDPPKSPQGGRRDKIKLDDDARALLNTYVGEDRELSAALMALMETRTRLRAVNSGIAIKTLLGKLDDLSAGDRGMKLRLIQESVVNSWKSVYQLKGGVRTSPPPARWEVIPID